MGSAVRRQTKLRYGHVQLPAQSSRTGSGRKTALLLRELRLVLVVWRLQPLAFGSQLRSPVPPQPDRIVPPAEIAAPAEFVGADQPGWRLSRGGRCDAARFRISVG